MASALLLALPGWSQFMLSVATTVGCSLGVLEAEAARELDGASLKTNQRGYYLEISNDLLAKLIVLQCTQQDFDILVL